MCRARINCVLVLLCESAAMHTAPPTARTPCPPRPWWATWQGAALVSLTLAVPLLWPIVPPLTDIYGHLARFAIITRIDTSPYLHRWFTIEWRLSGNLGVDILVALTGKVMGVVLATKLTLIATVIVTALGILLVAREAHGRIPPTAFFALPLVFAMPFQFGFLNFTLSVALAFMAIGVWMRLDRLERRTTRALLFVPVGIVLWVTHIAGWGLTGLAIFAIELVTARRRKAGFARVLWRAGMASLPLAAPIAIMLVQPNAPSTGIAQWFNWDLKLFYLKAVLRDQNMAFDIISTMLLYGLILCGLRGAGFRMEARLACAAGFVFVAFLLMPGTVMGSAFTDMRLLPCALALAILSLSPVTKIRRRLTAIAAAALLFLGIRLVVQTVSWVRIGALQTEQRAAIDHIPRGSRVAALVALPCETLWSSARMDHLALMAIVRRDAFVNGLWDIPSSQLSIHRPDAQGFVYAGSQALFPVGCRYDEAYSRARALATLPRGAFDYLWLVDTPKQDWPADARLRIIWSADRAVLYRILPTMPK